MLHRFSLVLSMMMLITCGGTKKVSAVPIKIQALLMGGYSATGFHLSLGPMLTKGKHRVFGGIEMQLSDSYLPNFPVLGFQGGYQFELIRARRWQTVVGVDFQKIYYHPYNPSGILNLPFNTILEGMGRLGLEYLPAKNDKVALGIYMGFGLLREAFTDVTENERRQTYSQTTGIRLGIRYRF